MQRQSLRSQPCKRLLKRLGDRVQNCQRLCRPRSYRIFGRIGLGPYPWLLSQYWAMPSPVLESTWANTGGTVIVYLAAVTA
jgi:hypothetical protein